MWVGDTLFTFGIEGAWRGKAAFPRLWVRFSRMSCTTETVHTFIELASGPSTCKRLTPFKCGPNEDKVEAMSRAGNDFDARHENSTAEGRGEVIGKQDEAQDCQPGPILASQEPIRSESA